MRKSAGNPSRPLAASGAVYRYVRDREHLECLMVEEVLAEVDSETSARLSYVIGAISVEQLGPLDGAETRAMAALSAAEYPRLADTARHAQRIGRESEFRQGLTLLLRGLMLDSDSLWATARARRHRGVSGRASTAVEPDRRLRFRAVRRSRHHDPGAR